MSIDVGMTKKAHSGLLDTLYFFGFFLSLGMTFPLSERLYSNQGGAPSWEVMPRYAFASVMRALLTMQRTVMQLRNQPV